VIAVSGSSGAAGSAGSGGAGSEAAALTVERRESVAVLTLNRPEKRNALDSATLSRLRVVLAELGQDTELRAVLIRGAGNHFCSGADLAGLSAQFAVELEGVLGAIEAFPVPVVAAVQGAALGAGLQLVLACDLRVVAEDARLGIPASRLGLLLNLENVIRLERAAGTVRAAEILYTGRPISGVVAADWGMVNQAVPAGSLETAAEELLERIASGAPRSVRGSKQALRALAARARLDRSEDADVFARLDALAGEALVSEDLQEGFRASMEKRAPRFTGR